MNNPIFKKTLIVSLLGHLTVFSVFGLSFGQRLMPMDKTQVSFLGGFLRGYDLNLDRQQVAMLDLKRLVRESVEEGLKFIRKPAFTQDNSDKLISPNYYYKPMLNLTQGEQKIVLAKVSPALSKPEQRRGSVVVFHPAMPYQFNLYFKDRQTAHIEHMFNIVPSGKTNSITVKRKISSGNLEVDLLSMRYISHYLFLQQNKFTPDKWQKVKIEFSAQND